MKKNTCKRHGSKNGFTLVELLVVISIIGVLSTIATTSLNGAKAKARDTRRNSDMNEIRNALELYYADHGHYPDTGGVLVCLGIPSTEQCWGKPYGSDLVNAALAPYLNIPKDPLYGRKYGTYVYRSPGNYWEPSKGTLYGAYSIAFEADMNITSPSCGGWIFGAWDEPSPAGAHCAGGSCRQCGFLKDS